MTLCNVRIIPPLVHRVAQIRAISGALLRQPLQFLHVQVVVLGQLLCMHEVCVVSLELPCIHSSFQSGAVQWINSRRRTQFTKLLGSTSFQPPLLAVLLLLLVDGLGPRNALLAVGAAAHLLRLPRQGLFQRFGHHLRKQYNTSSCVVSLQAPSHQVFPLLSMLHGMQAVIWTRCCSDDCHRRHSPGRRLPCLINRGMTTGPPQATQVEALKLAGPHKPRGGMEAVSVEA
mmetsp:Transcript_139595/g.242962  ORF Transcript_139595/g.242962 Transcript_139595/m.242962 type:complete len:230 (+) Transcript_139595:1722-2411(+)